MSYQVIARKYRPSSFDDVVGQRLVTDTLKNAIVHDRVAHGYIFSGARGVGKTTTARLLARALNCIHGPTVAPCGVCDSCLEIAAGNSVDVLEIDAASNRGIDEIRELKENVRYLPARDRYKIFIIDEAHMLTPEAFNALLKTLEEPPPRSVFILATTESHKLPATIHSRCQHFAFRLLDESEIQERLVEVCGLEKVQAPEESLAAIAQAAEGSMRDALSFLDEAIAASGNALDEEVTRRMLGVVPSKLLREMVESILAGDSRRVLEQVHQLSAEGYDLAHFCGEFVRYIRNLMIARSCGGESPLIQGPKQEREEVAKLAAQFREEDLARWFQVLLRTQGELRYSLHPRFHLEMGLIKLVHARKLVAIESLLAAFESGNVPARPRTGGPAAAAPPGVQPTASGKPSPRPGSSAPPGMPRAHRDIAPAVEREAAPPAPPRSTPESTRAASPAAVRAAPALPAESNAARSGGDARLEAIKAELFSQSKFLGSCLNPLAGWRYENGEVHFFFSREGAWAVDLIKSREHLEKLGAACQKVLGQPVRIYVKLGQEGATSTAIPSAQERAKSDAAVEAFRRRFEGSLMDVTDLTRE
ncbi:MAG TPA: DNA polymerase III subunit gamma/tau [Terriglobia bacterium]|nr:DNA polymerase III subunit gamma/tau [Terriglobia bacterium]